jgi:uncharacterized protein YkwD
MRRALLPVLLVLLVLAIPTAPAQAATCAGADTMPTHATLKKARSATLCLLNQERRAHGLPALRINTRLRRAATGFSHEMVRDGFFDHTAPDGKTFDERIVSAGYREYRALAENIAWGSGRQATPAEIVDGWMHSSGHRRNILDRDLRDIGIGIATGAPQDIGGQRAATYTTDFGRRR